MYVATVLSFHQVVREDYLVYDGYALFADTGGLVGVLLGMSCIAAFDYVVELVAVGSDLMGYKAGARKGDGK